MPRFLNVHTSDGAIGECAVCGTLIYEYQEMFYHRCYCDGLNIYRAREGNHDTTDATHQHSMEERAHATNREDTR